MSFGSVIHHLLMLPINLAQLLMIIFISPGDLAYKELLTIFSIATVAVSSLSWTGFQFAPLFYSVFWDQTSIQGLDDIQFMQTVYMKILSGFLNIGSASETLVYALTL